MTQLRRSLGLSFAHRYLVLIIGLARAIIMARLLAPEDYGVFALAFAIMNVAMLIGDFGVSVYLVQERTLDPARVRGAFTLSLVVSWSLAAALFIAGPALAALTGAPAFSDVLRVLCIILAAVPFTYLLNARLHRAMRFGTELTIGVTAEMVIAVAAVLLALNGFGVMSLAWSAALGPLVVIGLGLVLTPSNVGARLGLDGWREIGAFGMRSSIIGGLHQGSGLATTSVVFQAFGPSAAGLFNRAKMLHDLVNKALLDSLKPVTLAALSQHRREGGDIATPFLRKATYLSAFAWPGAMFVIAASPAIVGVLLGDQWTGVVPIFQILCAAFLVMPITALNFEFFIASGRIAVFTRQEFAHYTASVVGVLVGATISLEAAIVGFVLARFLNVALTWRNLVAPSGITPGAVWAALAPSAAISALCALPIASYVGAVHMGAMAGFGGLIVGAAMLLAIWSVGVWAFRHPIGAEVIGLLGSLKAAASREPMGAHADATNTQTRPSSPAANTSEHNTP